MPSNRRAGKVFVRYNGVTIEIAGDGITYGIGADKRETLVGADGVHGYSEMPQAPFIEGKTRDSDEFDLKAFLNAVDATVTAELNNGKTILLRAANQVGEGNVNSQNGEVDFRFEGMSGEEIS